MDWHSLLQSSMATLIPHLTLEKVLVSRDGTKLLICFLADKLVEEQEFLRLRDLLQRSFHGLKVSLRVCSPALADDVRRDITPYLPFLAECLSRQSPGVKPWLRNAEWRFDGDRLIVSLPSEMAMNYVRVREIDKRLAAIMEDVFRMQVEPVFICSVDLEAQTLTALSDGRSERFEIDAYKKKCLLNGYDDVDYLLSIADRIEAFEASRR